MIDSFDAIPRFSSATAERVLRENLPINRKTLRRNKEKGVEIVAEWRFVVETFSSTGVLLSRRVFLSRKAAEAYANKGVTKP